MPSRLLRHLQHTTSTCGLAVLDGPLAQPVEVEAVVAAERAARKVDRTVGSIADASWLAAVPPMPHVPPEAVPEDELTIQQVGQQYQAVAAAAVAMQVG